MCKLIVDFLDHFFYMYYYSGELLLQVFVLSFYTA